jgi:pre-mRNA cleavage complex 2 protein Pcf11
MVAEDYSETRKGAKAIYNIIRERLLSATVAREKLLPLVYLVDSIIKNAKGNFVKVIQADAIHWMPAVYKRLDSAQNVKMQRVWKTWKDGRILSEASLNAIEQQCFQQSGSFASSSSPSSSPSGGGITSSGASSVAGILRAVRTIIQRIRENELFISFFILETLISQTPQAFFSISFYVFSFL